MRPSRSALLLCLAAVCGRAACDGPGDGGLPAAEVSRTFERLFAIPTQAYTNAYGDAGVDMRPAMPTFTFGPADGGIMKLGMPSFALTETASASSVGGRVQPAPTTSLAQQGSDAVMSDLLGDDGRARPAVAASMGGPGSGLQQEVGESHKWAMGSQWLSLAQKSAASGDAASPATRHRRRGPSRARTARWPRPRSP